MPRNNRRAPTASAAQAQNKVSSLLREAAGLERALAPLMADFNRAEARCASKLLRLQGALAKSARRMKSAAKVRVHNRLLGLERFAAGASTVAQLRKLEAALDGMLGEHDYGSNLSDNRAYYDTNDDGSLDIPTGDEGPGAVVSVGKEPDGSALYPKTAGRRQQRAPQRRVSARVRLADLFDADPFGLDSETPVSDDFMAEDCYADDMDMSMGSDMDMADADACYADTYPDDGTLPDDDYSEDLYAGDLSIVVKHDDHEDDNYIHGDEAFASDYPDNMMVPEGSDYGPIMETDEYTAEEDCYADDDMEMSGLEMDDVEADSAIYPAELYEEEYDYGDDGSLDDMHLDALEDGVELIHDMADEDDSFLDLDMDLDMMMGRLAKAHVRQGAAQGAAQGGSRRPLRRRA